MRFLSMKRIIRALSAAAFASFLAVPLFAQASPQAAEQSKQRNQPRLSNKVNSSSTNLKIPSVKKPTRSCVTEIRSP